MVKSFDKNDIKIIIVSKQNGRGATTGLIPYVIGISFAATGNNYIYVSSHSYTWSWYNDNSREAQLNERSGIYNYFAIG